MEAGLCTAMPMVRPSRHRDHCAYACQAQLAQVVRGGSLRQPASPARDQCNSINSILLIHSSHTYDRHKHIAHYAYITHHTSWVRASVCLCTLLRDVAAWRELRGCGAARLRAWQCHCCALRGARTHTHAKHVQCDTKMLHFMPVCVCGQSARVLAVCTPSDHLMRAHIPPHS